MRVELVPMIEIGRQEPLPFFKKCGPALLELMIPMRGLPQRRRISTCCRSTGRTGREESTT